MLYFAKYLSFGLKNNPHSRAWILFCT